MENEILERIYAGFLGMNAGIRLGAPVEPAAWDFETIARFYGDIRGYVKHYRNFAADDDVNGPVYFLRALQDNGLTLPITAQAVGEAWLNYAREGIGLYWWGGEGISTEHTAYLNLKRGIPAPQSGSIAQNGIVLAEQIGGQIFIDTWGLICPGDPHTAATLATTAASVSHDGNGLYGAAFIAGCIAAAFEAKSIDEILEAGLAEIPQDSTYAAVVRSVREFHRAHPEDFRLCMKHLQDNWGYDRYPGVCHIIPNAGVCVLAMLYGQGDFARTIEIASMCGWDTDCNAGNVGTILGVFRGLEGIPAAYRDPINDFIVLSGISGFLNNLDAATYAKLLYQISLARQGKPLDAQIALPRGGELLFDFSLPGATHGLRLSSEIRFMKHPVPNGLEIVVDRILPEDRCDVYYKPFYRREDFSDERYKPVFSPTVYSGQCLHCSFTPEFLIPGTITVAPYLETAVEKRRFMGEKRVLKDGETVTLDFVLPDTAGDCISQVGFHVETAPETTSRVFAVLKMHRFAVTGKGSYRISTALCQQEFLQQTPFSLNRGQWEREGEWLTCRTEEPAQAMTGNYYTTDCILRSDVAAVPGSCLIFRATGTRNYTAAGFLSVGKIGFLCHEAGKTREFSVQYPWEPGKIYTLQIRIVGQQATLLLDGRSVACFTIPCADYGMVGFSLEHSGTGSFRDLIVEEAGSYVDILTLKPESCATPK